MSFINSKFEEIEATQKASKKTIKRMETENSELKRTISDLLAHMSNMEQQTRSNNIEIQCVPESKHENLCNIVTQLGKNINCDIKETEILDCTRIAKANPLSSRPRSIIVKLGSSRQRDQVLAAVMKYNHDNPQEKLNAGHLDLHGSK